MRVLRRLWLALQAIVRVRDGKGVKHDGIKVEFVGSIGEQLLLRCVNAEPPLTRLPAELFYDRGNHYEFLSLVQELATPGEMRTAQAFDFEFKNVEKQYESYHGINVKLRSVPLFCSLSMTLTRSPTQILRPSDRLAKDGRRRQGEGHLGALVPHATRLEQLDQDGGRN